MDTHTHSDCLHSDTLTTPTLSMVLKTPPPGDSLTSLCLLHAVGGTGGASSSEPVKKPLNAFMLYMKEMRHQVALEGPRRESAAVNRILGRRVSVCVCV